MACIVKNKEFDSTAKRLDIHLELLEDILYKLTNKDNIENPSDDQIRAELSRNKSNTWTSEDNFKKAEKYWENHFSTPTVVNTQEELNALKSTITQTMGENSIVEKRLYNGGWEVSVVKPTLVNKESFVRENRNIKDSIEILKKQAEQLYKNGRVSQRAIGDFNALYGTNFGVNPRTGKLTFKSETLRGISIYNPRDLEITAKKNIDRALLLDYLGTKFNLHFVELSVSEFNSRFSKFSNSVIVNDTVYIRDVDKDTLKNEYLIEEFLHPVINAIYKNKENTQVVNTLLQEAKQYFPDLVNQINSIYGKASQQVRDEEIITQVLSKYLNREISDKGTNSRSIVSVIKQFFEKIFEKCRDLFGEISIDDTTNFTISGKDIREVVNFDNLAKLINSKEISFADTLGETEIRYNVTEEVADTNDVLELSEKDGIRLAEIYEPKGIRESSRIAIEKSVIFTQSLKNILQARGEEGDILFSNAYFAKTVTQVAYGLSAFISEIQEDPQKLLTLFPNKAVIGEDGNVDLNATYVKIQSMSHFELAQFVGLENLIAAFKEDKYNPANNNFDDINTIDRAQVIYDNFDAILKMGATTFSLVENFGLSVKEDSIEAVDKLNPSEDNFNTPEDEESLRELVGDLRDHWQIESRTMDVLGSMSQKVKQQLARTHKVQIIDGKEEIVRDEFGIPEGVDVREAATQILNWTKGALTLSQMINRLAEKTADNPWLNSIVERLSDVSGKEYEFQSQFFTTFEKHSQLYSIVDRQNDGTYVSKIVNRDPALQNAFNTVVNARRTGDSPLFKAEGGIESTALSELEKILPELKSAKDAEDYTSVDLNRISALLNFAYQEFGLNTNTDLVRNAIINQESLRKIADAFEHIVTALNKEKNNPNYDPYTYSKRSSTSIYGNIREFLRPITKQLEDLTMSTVYDGGKMYQAFVTPSYLTKMMIKFKSSDKEFKQYMQETYGSCEWFRDTSDPTYKVSSWRTPWLADLYSMSESERKNLFEHKVQLNFNKHSYLRQMTDSEYTLSLVTEYFSEDNRNGRGIAWYGTSMMSNKPSSEFLRFIKYTDADTYKNSILDGLHKIFEQELSRIQTVRLRHERFSSEGKPFDKTNPRFIQNFDTRGLTFTLLTWLNEDITKKTEVGKLIERKLVNNEDTWTTEDEKKLYDAIDKRNLEFIDARATDIINSWEQSGLLASMAKVEKIQKEFSDVKDAARNFIWNNTFAQMNILEMTIVDPAYYKNVDDIQKRFAQLHSPGIRANSEVRYKGKRVASSTMRTIILNDFEGLKSNIIDNITEVYNRKIREAGNDKSVVRGLEALKKSVIDAFNNVNLTDAQAYSCPTSYRKKALMFGTWDEASERVYQLIKDGKVNIDDLKTTFQPLKPFVYTMVTADSGVEGAPIQKMMFGMQNKNSEYLLVMADALLRNEETSRPNLLKVLFEAMESSFSDGINGIDTIQFASAVKTGLSGIVDLTSATSEDEAAAILNNAIYSENSFNLNYVKEFPTEDYSIQQNNPEHFKDHYQAEGSQIRYGIVTDLPTTTSQGDVIRYTVSDGKESRDYTADEFKQHYEEVESARIELSINELLDELGAYYRGSSLESTYSKKDVNAAIYKMLQNEILSSQRYDSDMLKACQIDENGDFRLPLGDPVQSKRIEQLLNSVVKKSVNKQEIAGGPLIQVSNFGTSRELNIVFKEDGGIAYYEAFVSPYTNDLFNEFADRNGIIDIEAIAAVDPELLKLVGYRIPTEDKYSMAPIKIVGFLPKEAGDGIMLPAEITTITGSDFDVDKFFVMRKELMLEKRDKNKKSIINHIEEILSNRTEEIFTSKVESKTLRQAIRTAIDEGILGTPGKEDDFVKAVREEYLKYVYTTVRPEKGSRAALNNEVIDMDYTILTHPQMVDKVLHPGGFETQKLLGYKVAAKKANPELSWAELDKMSVNQLKSLFTTNDNIAFVDVLQRLYKYNSAAAATIGMSAVQKTAHAVLSGDRFFLDVKEATDIDKFTVGSVEFKDNMIVDPELDAYSNYIGLGLGELVAASADAVKDPVLNLMNINSQTMPILTAFMRMGLPFNEAALLLSSKAMDDVLAAYTRESLTRGTTIANVIRNTIETISRENQWSEDKRSKIFYEPLTLEEMIDGLTELPTKEAQDKNTVKILKAIERGIAIQTALKGITYLTRLNSISNAVGPLVIDNLLMSQKINDATQFKSIKQESPYNKGEYETITADNVFNKHPILNSFSKTIDIAEFMLRDMPANSREFGIIRSTVPNDLSVIITDREMLARFSEFYQSYLMLIEGVVKSEATEGNKYSGIKYYIETFPADFTRSKAKERYADNALIQAIQKTTERVGKDGYRAVLTIDTSSLDKAKLEELKAAWTDLHNSGEKGRALSTMLFRYNFFRGGIGFNPKTFMNLLPVEVKEDIIGYKDAFNTGNSANYASQIIDMFVRNNADEARLVPIITKTKIEKAKDGFVNVTFPSNISPTRYFKTSKISRQSDGGLIIYRIVDDTALSKRFNRNSPILYQEVSVLGNAGEYYEASIDENYKAMQAPTANRVDTSIDISNMEWESPELGEVSNNADIAAEINNQIEKRIIQKYNKEGLRIRDQYYDMYKNAFKESLKERGVTLNDESVDELWNTFCLRP